MFFQKPQPAPQTTETMARLPALDGARGLAVLLVLLDHASDAEMRIFPGADLNRASKYGVYLFFVLSAFLLTYQFSVRRREEFTQARTWLNYALRRFLRIFPAFAAVLLAYVLMGKLELSGMGQHLLLREGERHFWTIPVEVKYYFLLPFIALALFWAGRKHWLLGIAAGIGACAVGFGFSHLERLWSIRDAVLLTPLLAPFLIGSAIALASGALLRNPAAQRRLAVWLEVGALVAVVAIAMRLPAVHNLLFTAKPFFGKEFDPVICGALWSVFLLGALHGKGLLARCMEWMPMRFLGFISFSAYLWHGKFLSDVDDFPAPAPVRLLVYLAVVLVVATVSYWLLERPLAKLRLGRRSDRDAKSGVRSAAQSGIGTGSLAGKAVPVPEAA